MHLNRIFSRAAQALAGRRSVAELEKTQFMVTHNFVDPAAAERRDSALASKNTDGTWNVTSMAGDERQQSPVVNVCSMDHSEKNVGDIASHVKIEDAVAAMEKYEDNRFKAGARTDSVLYAIKPHHYATFKSAIARKRQP